MITVPGERPAAMLMPFNFFSTANRSLPPPHHFPCLSPKVLNYKNKTLVYSNSPLSFSIRNLDFVNSGRLKDFLRPPAAAAISGRSEGSDRFDPELRLVLELGTDSELHEIESILFGPSFFSPLLKSITNKADDEIMKGEDHDVRKNLIERLESRFFFLAADARSTLRGWRPSYRNVLLDVRRKLSIPCSSKLSTEDLEAEIFLHLLQENSSDESGSIPFFSGKFLDAVKQGSLEVGLGQWRMHALSVIKAGAEEIQSMMLKGGGLLSLAKIYQLLAKRLSGRMLSEAANYQIKREILKQGGRFAAINLEMRTALLIAKKGFASAASRYLGLRSLMMLVGPVLWGTFLADVVIQMIGTDYARILQAVYAFAQIRLTQTYGWASCKNHSAKDL